MRQGQPFRSYSLLALLAPLGLGLPIAPATAEDGRPPQPPAVLLVTAHPDDESIFAGAVHRIRHALGGAVDLAVITDGAGGFHFASLAEPVYGLDLTDERVARQHLPRIRQRELLAAGEILGIRRYFFFDEPDVAYTQDAEEVLERQWDRAVVRQRIRGLLERGRYDFVFVPLPTPTTHGAHQAAALVVLEAVAALAESERPAVLGATEVGGRDLRPIFADRPEYPSTRVPPLWAAFDFDRRWKVDLAGTADYRTIVDWVVAAHKTQGRLQGATTNDDVELYYPFALNGEPGFARARALFYRLAPRDEARELARSEWVDPRWTGDCVIEP